MFKCLPSHTYLGVIAGDPKAQLGQVVGAKAEEGGGLGKRAGLGWRSECEGREGDTNPWHRAPLRSSWKGTLPAAAGLRAKANY